MLTTKEVRSVLVCNKPRAGKEYTKDGLPRRGRKIGKVFKTVFSPDGLSVVGFIVRQPDLLWMFKRPEKFLALDSFDILSIISALNDEFDISIPAKDIVATNFNSAQGILAMVQRLVDED